MKKIKLTQGKFALVNDLDYKFLTQWKWYTRKCGTTWYAARAIRSESAICTIYMHRVILERTGHANFRQTDHRNGDGLNNQRRNLRPATHTQNQQNRRPQINESGYKGVSWDTPNKNWRAQIRLNGKLKNLGNYRNKLDAAKAYNKAAKKYFGKFARVNPDIK
jgi:hypothetical protein